MDEYISRETAVDAGYLSDWYISSVGDEPPVWTEAHIDELLNDFIVIPKNTKVADVQPVDRWISVKDRLPDENQKCLVYRDINADLKITTGIWHSEWKAFDGLRHGTRLEDTIAWMPLPEPPKE